MVSEQVASVVGVEGGVEFDARAGVRNHLDRAGGGVAAEQQPGLPLSSRALITRPSGTVTFVPAVTYSPASTTQSSPSEMPMPAFAPTSDPLPMEIRSRPPPDSVPMIDAPPPTSDPSATTTPCEIRPSTMDAPRVPALKLTNPSCMTVVPAARC